MKWISIKERLPAVKVFIYIFMFCLLSGCNTDSWRLRYGEERLIQLLKEQNKILEDIKEELMINGTDK